MYSEKKLKMKETVVASALPTPHGTVHLLLLLLLTVCLLLSPLANSLPISEGQVHEDIILERLAFGSCNKHDRPQPLWEPILKFKPDLWIWLGAHPPPNKTNNNCLLQLQPLPCTVLSFCNEAEKRSSIIIPFQFTHSHMCHI